MFSIREIEPKYRSEINDYIKRHWGGPMLVTLGNVFNSSLLPGFMAIEEGKLVGAALVRLQDTDCEIAALFSLRQGKGIGRGLIDAVVEYAKTRSCKKIWLVTTNDNTGAMRFYQKYGFTLRAAHIGSFEEIKRIKNMNMEYGEDGIRIEHEMEFMYLL